MLYNDAGFSLALGPTANRSSREAVVDFRDRLVSDGVPVIEEWDEPEYVSVKCRDPDGYLVEAGWEPRG